MSSRKTINNDLNFFLILLLLIFSILLPFILFKNSLFVITTPSMKPTLNVGDLVIKGNKPPQDIKVGEQNGDILILKGPRYFYEQGFDPIFWNYLDNNTPIIHRAIDKKRIGDKWFFQTKGDNNLVSDGAYKIINQSENYILIEYNCSKIIYISETEILGIVIFKIPFIGYINIYFPVFVIVIIVILIIYLIIKRLNFEIKINKRTK